MRQLDLTYRPAHTGHEGWLVLLEALRSAVAHIGQKDVCYELDVAKSTLSEALGEKNDKRWAGEWTCKVLAMLTQRGDDESKRYGRAIVESVVAMMPCFVVAEADDEPTSEEIEHAERVLAKARKRKRAA